MNIIKPARLRKGDTIGICSPSGTIAHKRELFDRAKANFERATGLHIIAAPNAFNRHYYSAGTPAERLADFHFLLGTDTVKAIIFSAGGDTAIDLVQYLDYERIRRSPKIIAGISDATTLLSSITAKTNLITFLGLEFLDFADYSMSYEREYIEKAWFSGRVGVIHPNQQWTDLHKTYHCYTGWQTIHEGAADGRLIGGNFQSFMQLAGTPYELSFPKAILFLETYRLPKKQIHKGLRQLKLHGVLDRIAGLVIGYCLESDNPQIIGNEQPLSETISEVTAEYDFPIMRVGEIGHCVENALQPLGV